MEIWKDVNGYEGYYQISNMGRIKSFCRKKSLIMSQSLDSKGYFQIKLKGRKSFLIHHLIMFSFVSDKPSKDHQVNHKNGIKTDNRIENLEWVTRSENMIHAYRLGLNFTNGKKGIDHPLRKLNEKDILEIRKSKLSNSELSKLYNVSFQTISKIKLRQRWKHI